MNVHALNVCKMNKCINFYYLQTNLKGKEEKERKRKRERACEGSRESISNIVYYFNKRIGKRETENFNKKETEKGRDHSN